MLAMSSQDHTLYIQYLVTENSHNYQNNNHAWSCHLRTHESNITVEYDIVPRQPPDRLTQRPS